ncbi:MAG: glycosyltransferase family 2 protein [Flavobacteriaceae bacterium]|jgi:glycosyltransferase involved in cell wall biosynthesis|nr:glycosyltransferase family 2 protein [Flavobacteriaceae bacterium]
MKFIKISVIVPCYNCVSTIEECINSIVQQSYPVGEIILVNDGSTDQTLEMLYSLEKKYSDTAFRITILTQQNAGPSSARNRGLDVASGDWIAFLDADDVWHKDKLERQVQVINHYRDIVVVGGGKGKFKTEKIALQGIEVGLKRLCFKNYFLTSSTIVKQENINKIRFNEGQDYSEDYRFFMDVLKNNNLGFSIDANVSRNIYNKRDYGDAGLSKDIWKMEKGELSNYTYLYQNGKISQVFFVLVYCFSIVKYWRRVVLNCMYKMVE